MLTIGIDDHGVEAGRAHAVGRRVETGRVLTGRNGWARWLETEVWEGNGGEIDHGLPGALA